MIKNYPRCSISCINLSLLFIITIAIIILVTNNKTFMLSFLNIWNQHFSSQPSLAGYPCTVIMFNTIFFNIKINCHGNDKGLQ